MAGVSKQKQKLLVMEQLFKERTDEAHALTGSELIKILGDMGIKAERKTIYDDIATLCDAGLNIETTKIGHSNAYYLGERLFSDEELKILADAVASTRFLTIKRSGELIRKLQTLTSEYKSPALRRAIHIENRTKASNDPVYRTLDVMQEAVFADKQVEINLSDNGADRKKQGKRISISPFHTVLENEHYYIVCRNEDEGKICRLRADRIGSAEISSQKRVSPSEDEELSLRKLKAPHVNEGTSEQLRILFDCSLIDDVFDRFGEKIAVHEAENGTFYTDVTVSLSPDFWGWLFKFGEKARIMSPAYVAEIACEKLEKIETLYRK